MSNYLPKQITILVCSLLLTPPALAQTFRLPRRDPTPIPQIQPLPALPPANELLKPVVPEIEVPPGFSGDNSVTIVVKKFKVLGSTVFSEAELAAVLFPFLNRPLNLSELLQARSAITQLYIDRGYITSGSYIPPQEPDPETGIVTIQVIEGRVAEIQVEGNRRLSTGYIRDRLGLATGTPLNVDRLVSGLRLLQLNALLQTVSAELAAGIEPGTSILLVRVKEADSFALDLSIDNYNNPTVGTWDRTLELDEGNLIGFGDKLNIRYTNTDGSNEVDVNYALPVNPHNGTIAFRFDFNDSHVIEEPFDQLDINSQSYYFELGYRQPIIRTPNREVALSLTASYQQSRSSFLENVLGESIPFPSLGSDDQGVTRLPVFSFAQDWIEQGSRQVLALRSEFNFGFNASNTVDFGEELDENFFIWRGQAQWVRSLAPDTLLLLRSQAQLTGNSLVSLEQFSLGGWYTVRGYRQDFSFTDNGVQGSAEIRLPLLRAPKIKGLLQGVVFVDAGVGWNVEQPDPDPQTLVGTGLGLQWQQSDRLNASIFWGIPLIPTSFKGDTLQEQGLYFSVRYRLF